MRVTWSERARRDRHHAIDYIAEANIRAAIDVGDRLAAIRKRLEQFPESGRLGRIPGTREYVVLGTPYIAVYRIVGATLRIMRLFHHAQRRPERL